ncbi:MAG: right-handed parallel beta-helix repeat-containing protein, partial [Methanobrevibacter sp.]|nr:right-handed parallel beta-helix repeat-containing protein [Methanobrevibacter sp.]
DIIIINGNFSQCHFTVNKTLTILGDTNAYLSPSPDKKHGGLNDFGVFYITEGGSGSLIKGFNFENIDNSEYPFIFYVKNASNVEISDCTIDYNILGENKFRGIVIENSNGITLSNLLINNSIYGIRIFNSTNVNIINCSLMNGDNYGISVSRGSKNITILDNLIFNNGLSGINLTCADYVNVINNYIKNNGFDDNTESGSGIYVNTNITKLVVKGNIFSGNAIHAIMYDYRVRNLDDSDGADELTIVDNNYFAGGHSSMILHHRIYIPHQKGDRDYDAVNDVFVYVGAGSYIEAKSYVYMKRAFVCDEEVVCGFTFYTNKIPWTLNAADNNGQYDLSLAISNIAQIKKGVYQVSIVDKKGNIASDFGSFDVTFYLNNNSNIVDGNMGLSKTVRIKNGSATVDFRDLADKYGENGSFITASFPGSFNLVKGNPYVQLFVDKSDVPVLVGPTQINIVNTKIEYNGDGYVATLVDANNKTLSAKKITVLIGDKSFSVVTNVNGQIKLPVLGCGSYNVKFVFDGDDNHFSSFAISEIVILRATPKLTFSQLTTYPVSDDYFKVKLTDNKGKTVSNQKITFKINGKTQTAKTDSNGIAKVKVSLTNVKVYSVSINYGGNNYLSSISKTGKIIVKTGSKKSKIT